MTAWKNENDERFNTILHRVLSEVLSETENAPVLAAICDAGVPLWFMIVLTNVLRASKFRARFFLHPRAKRIAVKDAHDGASLLKEFGFKASSHTFFGLDDKWIGPSDQPLESPYHIDDAQRRTLPDQHAASPV